MFILVYSVSRIARAGGGGALSSSHERGDAGVSTLPGQTRQQRDVSVAIVVLLCALLVPVLLFSVPLDASKLGWRPLRARICATDCCVFTSRFENLLRCNKSILMGIVVLFTSTDGASSPLHAAKSRVLPPPRQATLPGQPASQRCRENQRAMVHVRGG